MLTYDHLQLSPASSDDARHAVQRAPAPSIGVGASILTQAQIPRALAAVGPLVDSLYPAGLAKLRDRCFEAVAGEARGHLLVTGSTVAGFAMESPKAAGVVKLSTIWLAPEIRGLGYGRAFLSHLIDQWTSSNIQSVHLTARVGLHQGILQSFSPLGFDHIATLPHRYGRDRHEAVLQWMPSRSPDSAWIGFHKSRLDY